MNDPNFNCQLIKGRVAETIIQQLFLELGYHVFNFGMEYASPQMLGKVNKKRSQTALEIRSMPDFVIQTPNDGELYYLEVKFRKEGRFSIKSLGDKFPYKNALFVIVSKKKIQCISYSEMEAGLSIKPSTSYHLYERPEFKDMDKEKVAKYLEYCIRFFDGVE